MIKRLFILFILVISIFTNCKKNNDTVPNVAVNFTIDVTSPLYIKLNTVGGWAYVTGGVNGIVIRRNDIDQFMAFDRTSPYNVNQNNRIYVILPDALFAIDSVSGSRFSLLDGLPSQGPAKAPLKSYNADFYGSSLHVYN